MTLLIPGIIGNHHPLFEQSRKRVVLGSLVGANYHFEPGYVVAVWAQEFSDSGLENALASNLS